jgi:hypothetical protein
LTLLACLAACSGGSSAGASYGSGNPDVAAANPGGGPTDPFLADGNAVIKALADVSAKSGKPFRVTSLLADQVNGLTVEVQEPQNHLNVDSYKIAADGTMSGPVPVKLMSMSGGPVTVADVDRRAFDPATIPFANLEHLARQAIAKSNMADARVTTWEIAGVGPDDRRFLYLDAARGRPAAEISPALTIVHMSY